MGRGQGKATDGCNNALERLYTHQWSYQQNKDGAINSIESARHGLRILADGGKYRITDENGMYLRGPSGRVRVFGSPWKAMIAADNHHSG